MLHIWKLEDFGHRQMAWKLIQKQQRQPGTEWYRNRTSWSYVHVPPSLSTDRKG